MSTSPVEMPKPYPTPIDVSRVKKEAGVKDIVKKLLNFYGWFTWMPAANGYGTGGVSDHLAVKDGVFIVIEAKFGRGTPSALQKGFAAQIIANDCFAFCVNEKNIDHLAWWLESFAHAQAAAMNGQECPQEHGSRMLNAISVLTDLFKDDA